MSSAEAAFRACGSPAFLVLLTALLGLLAGGGAVVIAAVAKRRAGVIGSVVALGLAFACLTLGSLGMYRGRVLVERAVEGNTTIPPAMKEQILEEGYSEALRCIDVGAGGALLPAVLGVLALAIALGRARPRD